MAKSSRRFVGFQRTRFRRAPTPALAGPAASIGVRGIEISQCIQDLANSVTLVADKATIARLYLDAATVAKAGNVTAELAWSHEGGAEAYLPAMNTVRLDPAKDGGVQNQRTDLSQSLNFRLPPQAIGAGQLQLRLSRVYTPAGSDLPVGAPDTCTVSFTAAPPLRIRVIGLRYKIGTKTVAPDAVHFNYLRSYLGRAYPVAALEWSQVVVDADFASPFDDSTVDLANAQIAALRSREVSNGVDPRTHYFGLVSDNGGDHFMRGKAFAIPSSAQPDTVASGPCGTPGPGGFAGDHDLSYADWYGAHELGHTFGRYHPGFPKDAQDASDTSFPYADGFISTPDGRFVGLDTGDQALPAPMQALPGNVYHDVMTYADNQWLSAYTYQAILTRLIAEDALVPAVA
ncbi:hypothetical protein [Methylobacterium sp. SyP6R]|uniref:hypothetical protein n=1 Tax=Methylobacterium sp. SyP6R TaxID=2718876 RepID=UPI001F1DE0E7|nr:hypothetical protein [Methylobacterium sp. SyP6R]MCF4129936.1 hypothetical protein [Methylobacterium sp. SyP6R]